MEFLRGEHPNFQEVDLDNPNCLVFELYDSRPKVFPLNITSSDFEPTVINIGGSGGSIRTDSMMMKDWCTCFDTESEDLREELAGWIRWLTNRLALWAAYHALMTGRLVALDNRLGVHPMGICKEIRHLVANLV